MVLTTSRKDAVKSGNVHRNSKSSSVAGSDLRPAKGTQSERVAKAFETASRKTGAFESNYAKKRS